MSAFRFTIQHDRGLDEARARLEQAVAEARGRLGPMVQRVDWADDRRAVTLAGTGFRVNLRIDPAELHVEGDIGLLGALAGKPMVEGIKQVVQRVFKAQLPKP